MGLADAPVDNQFVSHQFRVDDRVASTPTWSFYGRSSRFSGIQRNACGLRPTMCWTRHWMRSDGIDLEEDER